MRAFILKGLGALTITASVLLPLWGLLVLLGADALRNSEILIFGCLVSIAVGMLLMIVHVNTTRTVSVIEKGRWIRSLWWGGPFMAGRYLWVAGGRERHRRQF